MSYVHSLLVCTMHVQKAPQTTTVLSNTIIKRENRAIRTTRLYSSLPLANNRRDSIETAKYNLFVV